MELDSMLARLDRGFAAAAIAVPVLYFSSLLVAAARYPGYSHVRQMVSELGMDNSPGAALFNLGITAAGGCAVVAGLGYFAALRRLGRPVLGAAAGLFIVLFGVALLMGGFFPLPDARHAAFGMGLAVHLAPLFVIPALLRLPGMRGLVIYLSISTLLMFGFLALMFGVGGVVTEDDFGLFQRLYALSAFPWIGIAGYALRHRAAGVHATAPAYTLAT
jgi:hypothetical membrane protein